MRDQVAGDPRRTGHAAGRKQRARVAPRHPERNREALAGNGPGGRRDWLSEERPHNDRRRQRRLLHDGRLWARLGRRRVSGRRRGGVRRAAAAAVVRRGRGYGVDVLIVHTAESSSPSTIELPFAAGPPLVEQLKLLAV